MKDPEDKSCSSIMIEQMYKSKKSWNMQALKSENSILKSFIVDMLGWGDNLNIF